MNEGMVEMDGSFKTTLHVPHKRCRSNSPSTPLPTCIICDPIGEGDNKMEGSPMKTVEEDMKAYCGLSSCCHVFHYDCVYVWLTQKSSTCPICRRSVEYIDKWILSKHARRSSSPHVTETIRVCIPTKVFEEKDWWTTSESTSDDSSDEDEIVCMYCRRGDREAELMLCSSEQCSSAAHYDCVQPRPLLCVPEGDWFCVSCQRRRRRAQQQSTRNNHRISSRQATSVMSVRDRNAMSEIQRHIPHNRNRTIIHNTAGAAMDENRRGTSEKERDLPLESALTTHVATTTAGGPDVTRVEMRRRFLFDDMVQDEASEQLNTSSQSRSTEIRSHTTRRAGGPGTMVSVEGLTGVPKPLLPLQRPTSSPPAMNENAVAPCPRDTKESTLSRFFSSSKFSPQLSGNAPSETHNMKNASSLHYEQLVEGLSDLNRRRSQNAVNQRYPPSTRTKISSGVVSLTVPYPVQPSTRGVLLKSNRDASSIHQPRASCESPRTADGPTSSTSSLQVMNSDVPLDRSQIRNEIIQTLRPTVLQGELSAGSAATLASSISGVLLSLAPAQRTKDRLLIICREKLSEYVRTKTIL